MMQQYETAPLINYGDIFWVNADESIGAISGSPHPQVVVQADVFNHSRITTVVVCSLSSNLKRASEPGVVLLDAGEGGLERQSVVISSQVSSVSKCRIPDDCIDPKRYPLFMARAVLQELIESLQSTRGVKSC